MKCNKCNKRYANKDLAKVLVSCMYWKCGLCFSTAEVTEKLPDKK
jgi:hypothetical protein